MPQQLRIDNLKVGDRVLVRMPYGLRAVRYLAATVSRKTPTGITTVTLDRTNGHEIVFGSYGRELGNRHSGKFLVEFDQQFLENSERAEMVISKRAMLEKYELWRTQLSNEAILKIAKIVEADLVK
jgi:hypothetical protein